MKRGASAGLFFSRSMNLVALWTGSDAVAEHEGGSDELMASLCSSQTPRSVMVADLRRGHEYASRFADAPAGAKRFPDLLEVKRIVRDRPELRFQEREGDVPEALLSYADYPVDFDDSELRFYPSGDQDAVGAWDSRSFGIRVRGVRQVRGLKAFHAAMKSGQIAFGGTFFKRDGHQVGGVTLVHTSYLSEDDHQRLRAAQLEYESNLRLAAVDDSRALAAEMRAASGDRSLVGPGWIWAKWEDGNCDRIVYCFNPGYGIAADYYGPYTRQQLLDWAASRYSYRLKRAA